MPARDGTGPMGLGPYSGKGFGTCPRLSGRGFGRGYGRGQGYGYRNTYGTVATKETLEEQRENVERQLRDVQNRIQSLK
ncbi:hypothetical protein SpiGrapes_1341 [Sphaerochaeta pleomorpha str. Grapes]|uniref:DUF5320 domain-containing protein n=1 Tax=Sphaerochaeta pleomorpha (strain ATCC BAA-1885 / DSM 22778 / Grapes) TaxID=158190 RepID=G8QTX8_SPHPG|nr:DUF5320 domain-containing protein [Sphaerochaeta pleomorpha]AEV29154.1 hypothetical protein SpiGrapes_1341 [Sphaerochaeta pleomorpha str. Grapes]